MTWRSRPSLTAAPSPTVEAALVSAGGGGRNTYPALARHPYRLWCHDCRGWEAFDVGGPSVTGEHFFTCARCGSAILCDECGGEFGTHHDCSPRQP